MVKDLLKTVLCAILSFVSKKLCKEGYNVEKKQNEPKRLEETIQK